MHITSTMIKSKILEENYFDNDILEYLEKKHIEDFDYKYHYSFKEILKTYLKNILKKIFGKNIIKSNRSLESVKKKYDSISGEYFHRFENKENSSFIGIDKKKRVVKIKGFLKDYYSKIISNIINHTNSINFLEVGCGEMSTMTGVLKNLEINRNLNNKFGGVDISLKRILYGKKLLDKNNFTSNLICQANGSALPFKDNSYDFVFTCHCLEQVPDMFEDIYNEILRVTRKYVVLLEPSYEFGSKVSKNYILKKGYIKLNDRKLKKKNVKIIFRELLPYNQYINSTEIVVLEVDKNSFEKNNQDFISPINKSDLTKKDDYYIDAENEKFYSEKDIPIFFNQT